jgi:GT2 family glycosyltransferase
VTREPIDPVDDALTAARLAVARAEARRDEACRQLTDALVRVRAFSALWRSPLRTLAWTPVRTWRAVRRRLRVRRPFSWGPLAIAGAGHFRWQARRLRDERMILLHSSQPGEGSIRWLGLVDLDAPREALFAHPDSRVVFQVAGAPRPARLVACCALHPATWAHATGVEFACVVRRPSTGWQATASVALSPGRIRDRGWRRLVIALPPGDDLEVEFTTRATSDRSFAWALWGDPRLEWRRTGEERLALVRGAWARFRTGGVRGVASALRSLRPADASAGAYRRWLLAHTPGEQDLAAMRRTAETLPWQPLVSVVTPVFDTNRRWLRAAIESVRRQAYTRWELCLADDGSTAAGTLEELEEAAADPRIRVIRQARNAGIAAATNAALEVASGEFVAFLDHDDELAPEALFEVVKHLNAHPETDLLYSDEDKLDEGGERCEPYFKPDWSPDQFLSFMYTCHLMVVRRSLVTEAGGLRSAFDGAQDYDLVLRLMRRTDRIRRVTGVLYHWRKTDVSTAQAGAAKPWAIDAGRRAIEAYLRDEPVGAEVVPLPHPGLFRVRYRIPDEPLVSIVIPTRGRTRLLQSRGVDILTNCLRSLATRTEYRHYEVVLVADRGELSESASRALKDLRHVLVRWDHPGAFNFSRKVNAGVAASHGAHVLLLNDDTEVRGGEWLTAMLEHSARASVGAVGAKLYYPDGRLQHVGILLGVAGIAAHAFHQAAGDHPGYAGSNIVIRNVGAVTGACMLTRREVFDSVGGFDETLAVDFNDVDYCLKLRHAGYRIVFTPFAELTHHESASFGTRLQSLHELRRMEERWGEAVRVDPYYHPALTRARPDFGLDA